MAVGVIGVRGPGSHGNGVQGQGGHHGVESGVGGLRKHGEAPGGEGGGELQGHQGQGGDEGGQGDAPYGTAVGNAGRCLVRGGDHVQSVSSDEEGYRTRPRRRARATACTRSFTPSFW